MTSFYRGYTTTATAAGVAEIEHRPRSANRQIVKQVAVETPGRSGGIASIRINGFLITPVTASMDAAGGDPPIPLDPGDVMTVLWTGMPVGQLCKATVFWEE